MLPGVFGPGDSDNPYKVHALNGIIIRMIESHKKKEKLFKVWGTGKTN